MSFEPFGFGKRKCVGYRFAEAEGMVLISTLVRKFKIKLASNEEPELNLDLITTPKEDIWVVAELRN